MNQTPSLNQSSNSHSNQNRKDKTVSWKYFPHPEPAWEALYKACEEATKNIDIEEYIFINDEIGNRFIELFKKKAGEGVKVRLLIDTAGSFSFYSSFASFNLPRKNLEVIFFNTFVPVIFRSHFTWWYFRDHRKLAIIDHEIGFTGSISIWDYTKKWRDSFIEIKGEVVEEMQDSFNVMWQRAQRRPIPEFITHLPIGVEGFNFVTNTPRPNKRKLYYRIVEAIRHAQKYIYITTPYFIPDRRIMRILRLARSRGVEIKIILPESGDHQLVDIAARSFFNDLLKAGIKIHIYKNNFIHEKVVIIDDSWISIGSMNLDNLGLTYNFEANLISNKKDFILELKNQFNKDLENTEIIEMKDWKKRSIKNKWLEWLVKLIRKFL